MALSTAQKEALTRAAEREGVDPAELLAAAEQETAEPAPAAAEKTGGDAKPAGGRPVAERLLVGFLPFIKVHELRALWLGLPDRIPDDEMTCGDFAAKHGGATATPPSGATTE